MEAASRVEWEEVSPPEEAAAALPRLLPRLRGRERYSLLALQRRLEDRSAVLVPRRLLAGSRLAVEVCTGPARGWVSFGACCHFVRAAVVVWF